MMLKFLIKPNKGWRQLFVLFHSILCILFLYPVIYIYYWHDKKKLYSKECKLSSEVITKLKIKKLYRIGFASGFLFSDSILFSNKFFRSLRFGRLSAVWTNYILIIDGYNDLYGGSPLESSLNILGSYKNIFEKLSIRQTKLHNMNIDKIMDSINAISPYRYPNLNTQDNDLLLTSATIIAEFIGKEILFFFDEVDSDVCDQNLDILRSDFTDLIIGQINSHRQLDSDNSGDWLWYCNNVLHQKTWPVFSLNAILPRNKTEFHNREILYKGLSIINDIFIHLQFLDDLDDILEDSKSGIYGAPGYLLKESLNFSKNTSTSGNHLYQVSTEVLGDFFSNNNSYVRYANEYVDLMKKSDYINAYNVLVQSGLPMMCINSIENSMNLEIQINKLKSVFRGNTYVVPICSFFYYSCSKSLKKSKTKYTV